MGVGANGPPPAEILELFFPDELLGKSLALWASSHSRDPGHIELDQKSQTQRPLEA